MLLKPPNDIEHLIDQPPNDDSQTIETIVTKPPPEVPLGRSHREQTSAIPNDYVVSLQRSESDIGICKEPIPYSHAIKSNDVKEGFS